jgi:uncharacterized membrane protein HdeD (DUF308 family)
MFHIPTWILILVGGLVSVFGVFRIFLGFRSAEEDERARSRGGLFGMRRTTHIVIGLIYVVMGVFLILGAFGVRPPWLPSTPTTPIPRK